MTAENAWIIAAAIATLAATATGVYWTRHYTQRGKVDHEGRQLTALQNDFAVTSLRLLEVENLVKEYERGRAKNDREMARANVTPAWEPTEKLAHITNGGSQLVPLYDLLYAGFSDDELMDLAFRAGIGRGVLVETSHSALARSLVEHADRRGIVDDLVRIGKGIRPDLVWPGNLPKEKGHE